jgi:hypothetical protein
MTLTFHLYFDGIEVAEPEIYRSEIERYRRDSKRCLADRKQRIYDAAHRAYVAMRDGKAVQIVSLLLIVALPLVAQTHV